VDEIVGEGGIAKQVNRTPKCMRCKQQANAHERHSLRDARTFAVTSVARHRVLNALLTAGIKRW